MSEGIYRKPGTSSSVAELLTRFRKDGFAVQLTTDQHNEYEVSTALKRFFRDLPEPLLGSNQRQYYYEVASKYGEKFEKCYIFNKYEQKINCICWILFTHIYIFVGPFVCGVVDVYRLTLNLSYFWFWKSLFPGLPRVWLAELWSICIASPTSSGQCSLWIERAECLINIVYS